MSVSLHHAAPGRLHAAWRHALARRRRRAVAQGFQAALDDLRHPPRSLSARIPVMREQVLDATHEIDQLIARLRDERRPVSDDALELARALLCDRGSPLIEPARPDALRQRLRAIREAME